MRSLAPVLALLAALAAPAPAQTSGTSTYVHLTTREWFTLEPAAAYDAVSLIVTGNVYEPLVTFASAHDPERLVPMLAAEVPSRENGLVSPDGLTYSFPIRKGVRFHDGSLLTPEDVRYSLLRFMLHDLRMGSGLLLKPVLGVYRTRDARGRRLVGFREAAEAIRVEGDRVVVRLRRPEAAFLKVVASLPIIVSKGWAAAHGEWDGSEASWERYNRRSKGESYLHDHMNGTGPFRLETADAKEGVLTLRRHDAYWRAPASLERVALKVVPNPALRLWMLENGDADGSYFEGRDFYDARESTSVRVVEGLPRSMLGEAVFFTFRAEPGSEGLGSGKLDGRGVPPDFFSDRDIREAFACSLDYEGYYARGMGRRGRRAAGPFPDGLLAGQGESPYRLDLRRAEELFRKAYGGALWEKGFTATLAYSPSNVNRVVLAEMLAETLKKLNPRFKLLLRPVPSRRLYEEAGAHRLPLYISSSYADYPDPQAFAFALLYSGGYSASAQRYSDPELDRLFEEVRAVSEPAARRDLFLRMSRIAARDVPQVYTFQPEGFRALHERVRELDPDQNVNGLGSNGFPYFYSLSK